MKKHATQLPSTVIGFDWGTQKIGVAVGQAITNTAQPLDPMKSNDGVPDWNQVAKLIEQWQPDALVVGRPLHMDGTETDTTRRTKKFANRLEGRFQLPVFMMDERLTTFAARQELKEQIEDRSWPKKFKQHGFIDSVAAALIVESWFQSHGQENAHHE